MPHPDAEHSLRIQLATALRELDDAREGSAVYQRKSLELADALAAARRECAEAETMLRSAIAYKDWDAVQAVFTRFAKARPALAAPAAASGEEGTR